MSKPLTGSKIAILVANGFNEKDLTHTQRALQTYGANTRIIGMDNGLINSWTGEAWGHHFASDCALNSALAADFTMLVVPGGRRSIEKLKLTAHTRRFIGGFMDAGKPVAFYSEAVDLLAFAERAEGRQVACSEASVDILKSAGATISSETSIVDGNMISGHSDDIDEYISEVLALFTASDNTLKQAA